MKSFEELTKYEKSVLLIWGKELNYNTRTHHQIDKINKKIDTNLPEITYKDKKRINKTLLNSGFIVRNPTGRSNTYRLSLHGLRCVNIIKREKEIKESIKNDI